MTPEILKRTPIINNMDDLDLEKLVQAFIIERKSQGVSSSTIRIYNAEFGAFLSFCGENQLFTVQEITPLILRSYLLYLGDKGRNPGGVNLAYRNLKTLLNWYDHEIEPRDWKNPFAKVKNPRVPIEPLEPVEIDDIKLLCSVCRGEGLMDKRDYALFLFLLDTGVRASEACNVNLEDMDLLSGTLLIRHGKGGKPRHVSIGRKATKAIRQYLKTRTDTNPALWITHYEKRISYEGLNGILRRRSKQAGINKPSLHDFRRAFAINCLRGGMDIFTLQKLMGHADLQVLRRYLAQNNEDLIREHAKASPVDRNL